jgi:hypothetical protein
MMRLVPLFGKRPKLSDAVRHFAIAEREIARETRRLFNCTDAGAHDSRYDVTATLLVAHKAHIFIYPWIKETAVADSGLTIAAAKAAATAATNTPKI